MRRWLGLLRSVVVYWRPGRQAGLRALYAPFVGRGDLVFDVGPDIIAQAKERLVSAKDIIGEVSTG